MGEVPHSLQVTWSISELIDLRGHPFLVKQKISGWAKAVVRALLERIGCTGVLLRVKGRGTNGNLTGCPGPQAETRERCLQSV